MPPFREAILMNDMRQGGRGYCDRGSCVAFSRQLAQARQQRVEAAPLARCLRWAEARVFPATGFRLRDNAACLIGNTFLPSLVRRGTDSIGEARSGLGNEEGLFEVSGGLTAPISFRAEPS
jgi:hypothetical protein